MRRTPESPRVQRSMFSDDRPLQSTLKLDGTGELQRASSAAVAGLEAGVRLLNTAEHEARLARASAVGTDRECALVEAVRILEAARCACLNARGLLSTIPPGPLGPVHTEE